ncbi:DNA/RNA helicase domain-containing protein [Corynebacterium variabile]|uniref:DNA/RNA helicase domain-containing protein n=1 Tax=Corynebacterium variabile TaxID=1727 RepID=UPI0035E403F3
MPLLRTTAAELLTRFANLKDLGDHMATQAGYEGLGHSPAERHSWEKSIPELAKVLKHAGLEDVDVLLEQKLPLNSKRVDAIIAGTSPATGLPSFVVVELKQWSAATIFEDDPNLVDVPGTLGGPRLHPLRQVDTYRELLTNFLTVFDGHPETVQGAVFLHNVSHRAAVGELGDYTSELRSELFTGGDIDSFATYLKTRVSPTRDASIVDRFMDSAVAPSQQLLTSAAAEIRDRAQFILLDRQRQAMDMVLHAVDRADKADTKRVIVVSGGPGTGKSVVALSLLGELARRGKKVLHATGSQAFKQTMEKVAGHRHRATQDLFQYFNSFLGAEKHSLDVLIADEAHRIRETSTNRYTKAHLRTGRPQIDELIDVARTPVFLLDENQVVRPGELGSLHEITEFAKSKGLEVQHVELTEQFRCGGSLVYTNWVEEVLGLSQPPQDAAEDATEDADTEGSVFTPDFDVAAVPNITVRALDPENPPVLKPQHEVAISVVESPEEMERILSLKAAEGYSARIAAGFCWRWSKVAKGQRELAPDVRIGDWQKPWNNPEKRRVGNAPQSFLWATGDGGFGQVGCIYTAQGFEYDWSGVIIGPDMVWRDGGFRTVRAANVDPALRKRSLTDHDFDVLIRHVYKVLLTRGMQGTVIYSPDRQTRKVLRQLLGQGAD